MMKINSPKKNRLVIVSNRLPIKIEMEDSQPKLKAGEGGLVTAMAPLLHEHGGIWVGWPGGLGIDEATLNEFIQKAEYLKGFQYIPVYLTKEELDLYYYGFSNEIIWPLFHDMQTFCQFDPEYWKSYQSVNAKFAETLSKCIRKDDFIWVQDYQLILVGQALRERKAPSKLGFFLHIPFPPLDIFMKLPWRSQLIKAMLSYDLIGFQTPRDAKNFINCLKTLQEYVQITKKDSMYLCHDEGKEIRIGPFPIGIDAKDFSEKAASPKISKVSAQLRNNWIDQKLLLSVDRLDYSKGITQRLRAIRIFLRKYPEFHRKVCFIQFVIPSRVEISGYQSIKQEIDQLVGNINSEFTHKSWVPIHYEYHSLPPNDLLAYYRTADVMIVTSLKDGMNLVSKEYAACQIDKNGVLILSEFAGSASQLHRGAILVHPYDIENVADAINRALTMPALERRKRMESLQRTIKHYDIFWWMDLYLNTAYALNDPE